MGRYEFFCILSHLTFQESQTHTSFLLFCVLLKHVIFGEVLEPDSNVERGQGMSVLDHIMEVVEVNPKNHRPNSDCQVVIDACGQI